MLVELLKGIMCVSTKYPVASPSERKTVAPGASARKMDTAAILGALASKFGSSSFCGPAAGVGSAARKSATVNGSISTKARLLQLTLANCFFTSFGADAVCESGVGMHITFISPGGGLPPAVAVFGNPPAPLSL
jgi:hypothetical protein